jgi:phosphatidylserine/phosphatidylglycerophosphate/cardiolipin synthase-like enzyme
MDAEQYRSNTGGEYNRLRQAGIDVRLDSFQGAMHHKVIVVDGQVVIFGSYNFSRNAETSNDENLLIVYSPAIATQFESEFERLYTAAQ